MSNLCVWCALSVSLVVGTVLALWRSTHTSELNAQCAWQREESTRALSHTHIDTCPNGQVRAVSYADVAAGARGAAVRSALCGAQRGKPSLSSVHAHPLLQRSLRCAERVRADRSVLALSVTERPQSQRTASDICN